MNDTACESTTLTKRPSLVLSTRKPSVFSPPSRPSLSLDHTHTPSVTPLCLLYTRLYKPIRFLTENQSMAKLLRSVRCHAGWGPLSGSLRSFIEVGERLRRGPSKPHHLPVLLVLRLLGASLLGAEARRRACEARWGLLCCCLALLGHASVHGMWVAGVGEVASVAAVVECPCVLRWAVVEPRGIALQDTTRHFVHTHKPTSQTLSTTHCAYGTHYYATILSCGILTAFTLPAVHGLQLDGII